MIYKTALIFVIALVGIGLIVNGDSNINATNQYPALLTYPTEDVVNTELDFSPVTETSNAELIPNYGLVLVRLHEGQWFGWSDSYNKIYENLIIHDNRYSKPSKALLDSLFR